MSWVSLKGNQKESHNVGSSQKKDTPKCGWIVMWGLKPNRPWNTSTSPDDITLETPTWLARADKAERASFLSWYPRLVGLKGNQQQCHDLWLPLVSDTAREANSRSLTPS